MPLLRLIGLILLVTTIFLALAAAARAAAYLEGRPFVVPEDVQQVAVAVLSHRLVLSAQQLGMAQQEVIKSLLENIPVPIG